MLPLATACYLLFQLLAEIKSSLISVRFGVSYGRSSSFDDRYKQTISTQAECLPLRYERRILAK